MRTQIRLTLAAVIVILSAFAPSVPAFHIPTAATVSSRAGLVATQESADTSLAAMLAHLPAVIAELEDSNQAIAAYADIAAQLAAFDLDAPERMTDDGDGAWAAVITGLPFPSPALQYQRAVGDHYGFDLVQVDQALSIALPPFERALYRGRLDEARIVRALRRVVYTPVGSNERPILPLRGDFEQDILAPAAYKLSAMNYATVLDDGTLAFSSAQGALVAMLAVEAGQQSSLAERDDMVALLVGLPDGLVSAHILHGSALATGVPDELLDMDATENGGPGAMPPVEMARLGFTAVGPIPDAEEAALLPDRPDANAVIVLRMRNADAATSAVPVLVERPATESSEQTKLPYADLFPERTVEAMSGTPEIWITLTLGEGVSRGILMQLLYSRDLGFLAW